jgi:hypothetical protein
MNRSENVFNTGPFWAPLIATAALALLTAESVKASIAGSGDVKYWGDAKVTQSVAGSGSIKRLGTAPN